MEILYSTHLLLSLALAVPLGVFQPSAERQESPEITGAIAQLWCDNEPDRDLAKATLLALGKAAILPLMDVVSELGDNGRASVVYPCPSHDPLECDLRVQRERRVRSDAIALLGRLRAVQAVPLLIKMLRLGDSPSFGVKYRGPEIEALAEIGKRAVPQLLTALERADRVRSSTEGPRSSVSLVLEERLADVLAEIGDATALPVLERLRIQESNEMLIGCLDGATAEIKKRTAVLGSRQADIADEDQAMLAIRRLGSQDPVERKTGREEIVRLGHAAAPQLLAVLREGVLKQNTWVIIPKDEAEAAKVESALETESRIQSEVYELVGTLRLEQAVPLLIQAMEQRTPDNLMEKRNPDMTSLAKIGPAAVPNLIESIENAEATALRRLPNGLRIPAIQIQIRSAIVLGDIGDARALPVLEQLSEQTDIIDFWFAVQQIKKKNGMDYDQLIDTWASTESDSDR